MQSCKPQPFAVAEMNCIDGSVAQLCDEQTLPVRIIRKMIDAPANVGKRD
jgi:hypothetical protein